MKIVYQYAMFFSCCKLFRIKYYDIKCVQLKIYFFLILANIKKCKNDSKVDNEIVSLIHFWSKTDAHEQKRLKNQHGQKTARFLIIQEAHGPHHWPWQPWFNFSCYIRLLYIKYKNIYIQISFIQPIHWLIIISKNVQENIFIFLLIYFTKIANLFSKWIIFYMTVRILTPLYPHLLSRFKRTSIFLILHFFIKFSFNTNLTNCGIHTYRKFCLIIRKICGPEL